LEHAIQIPELIGANSLLPYYTKKLAKCNRGTVVFRTEKKRFRLIPLDGVHYLPGPIGQSAKVTAQILYLGLHRDELIFQKRHALLNANL
jgi:hypothetical protein